MPSHWRPQDSRFARPNRESNQLPTFSLASQFSLRGSATSVRPLRASRPPRGPAAHLYIQAGCATVGLKGLKGTGIKGDGERRDKPAHCRGCKSPTEKEKRLYSGLESCLWSREGRQRSVDRGLAGGMIELRKHATRVPTLFCQWEGNISEPR